MRHCRLSPLRSHGQPTFLNLGHPYPNEDFAAVIWGENRAEFASPDDLEGRRICVTGQITVYHGKPQITLHGPSQLKECAATVRGGPGRTTAAPTDE